jgi:hypothetical protein
MSFVFPILLGGLSLVAVPVLIHLIMRQKPRRLPFPAFRFLLARHRTNLRKLKLRHLLLLALRVLMLAVLCLALARPKISGGHLALRADRPVAAVLLFDTSYSMEYRVSGGPTRLEEAKKRGLELLDELPEGSRVVVLDTAEGEPSGRGVWLASLRQARERVEGLRLRHANSPVTTRLETAYRLFADLALGADEGPARSLPRLLCVFSDRTRACWDGSKLSRLQESADQVPPPLERLQPAAAKVPALVDLLRELRTRLPPPAGQDYPEQAVIDLWQQLRDRVPSLTAEEYPDRETASLLTRVRARSRELLGILEQARERVPEGEKEYHAQLVGALRTGLDDLRGAHEVFVDVGVDNPVNLAIVGLELPQEESGGAPRQVFAPDEKVVLRAVVEATGKDFDTSILCRSGGRTTPQPLKVKAGARQVVPFEIDCQELAPGPHAALVRLATPDLLPFDNTRFATFAVREPRKVLILADTAEKAEPWRRAIEARKEARFRCTVEAGRAAAPEPADLAQYQAVYLLGLARPAPSLWTALHQYVDRGGGVGVIPGGEEMDLKAYDEAQAAQALLPGKLTTVVARKDPGSVWGWGDERIYQHPLLKPVREWRSIGRDDFIKLPRGATYYWNVEPGKEGVSVLVRYADDKKRPALLERRFPGEGKVLLFTTRLDAGQQPRWNNYMDAGTSFCVVLPGLTTAYLAGDAAAARLNFVTGQGVPEVRLPLGARAPAYTVEGPGILETVPAGGRPNVLEVRQATAPGNYVVEDPARNPVGAFSVNMPPEESVLTRVPALEVEALFGAGAVVPVNRRGRLIEALQGHWDQPVELLPSLLLLLLMLLAAENLLGNLFYRREPQPDSVR